MWVDPNETTLPLQAKQLPKDPSKKEGGWNQKSLGRGSTFGKEVRKLTGIRKEAANHQKIFINFWSI